MKTIKCLNCGSPIITRWFMEAEIMRMVGAKHKRGNFSCPGFNKAEVFIIYTYLKRRNKCPSVTSVKTKG